MRLVIALDAFTAILNRNLRLRSLDLKSYERFGGRPAISEGVIEQMLEHKTHLGAVGANLHVLIGYANTHRDMSRTSILLERLGGLGNKRAQREGFSSHGAQSGFDPGDAENRRDELLHLMNGVACDDDILSPVSGGRRFFREELQGPAGGRHWCAKLMGNDIHKIYLDAIRFCGALKGIDDNEGL